MKPVNRINTDRKGTFRFVRISQVSVLRVLSEKHMFYRCEDESRRETFNF